MTWYQVLVIREASEHTTVKVEADSVEEAEELATKAAESSDDWELDDGNFHEPYICDPGNCARECDPPAPPVVDESVQQTYVTVLQSIDEFPGWSEDYKFQLLLRYLDENQTPSPAGLRAFFDELIAEEEELDEEEDDDDTETETSDTVGTPA